MSDVALSLMVFRPMAAPTEPEALPPARATATATATPPASAVMTAPSVELRATVPAPPWLVVTALAFWMADKITSVTLLMAPAPAPASAPEASVLLPLTPSEPPIDRASISAEENVVSVTLPDAVTLELSM